MSKFICLNEACGNDVVKPLIVNANHIQHIQIGNKGKDVHIRMSDKTFFFVRESLVEIKEMIYGEQAAPKPPMMMTRELARELGLLND